MGQWWQRNSNVDLGSYTRNEIEDLTGSIPLLLDSCVVDGKINLSSKALIEVFDRVQQFMTDIKGTQSEIFWQMWATLHQLFPRNIADLHRHCNYVTACISSQPVTGSTIPEIIDHRYFYADYTQTCGMVGKHACSISREA